MNQPVPQVSRSDVERIARRDFGDADADKALAILDEYQSDCGDPFRVQLAVLKLAHGNLDSLRLEIEATKCDFRDVLASAEYPRYSREIGFQDVPASLKRAVIVEDWKQYESWLRR